MIGPTGSEWERAVATQGPGTGMCLAIAEAELYWENHRKNAPDIHELRMNLRIDNDGTTGDRIAAVEAIADWLGVTMEKRNGCFTAQRRFGTSSDSVIIEAHYTPNPAQAHLERLAAKAGAASEMAGVTA
jgi:hypothetical protein